MVSGSIRPYATAVADVDDQLSEDAPLTPDEILTFGPCVESVVHTPIWLQERRAPIAVAAGKPKLGKVFDDQGIGEAIVIRPCMSRGRRVRGLPPVYTPRMLEANASVFNGWPMFTDHVPPELVATMAKHGRSVRELGGQLMTGRWRKDYVHEEDSTYGYRQGAVQASVWATPFIRKMVGENPGLLHTSINAWPTSGKPGPVPWAPKVKGMLIEGIRRQPQGSVDYVVRGGAGGRLLLIEGAEEDEPGWPEVGEWDEDTTRFVVSLAESFYASRQMAEITLPSKPDQLAAWLQEHAPHLVPALTVAEIDTEDEPLIKALMKRGKTRAQAEAAVASSKEETAEGLSEADVQRMIAEANSGTPTVEEFTQSLEERVNEMLSERESLITYSGRAIELIEAAEGIPATWKADLKARYRVAADSTPAALLVESADLQGEDGATFTPEQVIEGRVKGELQHVRELLAEARGKPRPTGEGAPRSSNGDNTPPAGGSRGRSGSRERTPHWRTRFSELGLAESEDKALEVFGVEKAEG